MRLRFGIQLMGLIVSMLAIGGLSPFASAKTIDKPPVSQPSSRINPQQAQAIIEAKANVVLRYLTHTPSKTGMTQLGKLVHPQKGLRFSPYGHVQASDLVFKRRQLPLLAHSQKTYTWGSYDGSGEPINLNFKNYWQKFVANRDFSKAQQIFFNNPQQRGNSLNNVQTFYPDSIVVEYFLPATTPNGMDWASLKLVFQPVIQNRVKQWYLVGVVHDQWTI